MIAVPFPADIELRLEALSRSTGRPTAYYVEQAVIEYLDDIEDFHLAEREVEDLRAGRSTADALATVMQRHGLAD